jgi:hypothetical protein
VYPCFLVPRPTKCIGIVRVVRRPGRRSVARARASSFRVASTSTFVACRSNKKKSFNRRELVFLGYLIPLECVMYDITKTMKIEINYTI